MRIAWGRGWLLVVVVALSVSVGAFVPSGAFGRTWMVANGNDSGSGSLRATIAATSSGDIVVLPPRVYHLTGPGIVIHNSLTVEGAGANTTAIQRIATPSGGAGIFSILAGQQLYLAGVTLSGGNARTTGVSSGGAILVLPGASLELVDSAVTHNQALYGGGLFVSGAATVIRSTIADNQAGGAIGGPGEGGGIYAITGSSTELDDSTVAGNSATGASAGGGGGGGGIYLFSDLALTSFRVLFSTIADNSAGYLGGNLAVFYGGFPPLEIGDSIVAGGVTSAAGQAASSNCYMSRFFQSGGIGPQIVDAGHNLEDHDQCLFSSSSHDLVNTNPRLAALANNGGDTDTVAPMPGSPAIDGATLSHCSTVDQRHVLRPQGTACDIGAVEVRQPHWFPIRVNVWLIAHYLLGARFTPKVGGDASLILETGGVGVTAAGCTPGQVRAKGQTCRPAQITGHAYKRGKAGIKTTLTASLTSAQQTALKHGKPLRLIAVLTYSSHRHTTYSTSHNFTIQGSSHP